jgi:excinuclease ABC subunit C
MDLKNLPSSPGVYLMKGEGGALLYVGKAKSLADRVRSYFQPSASHTPRIRHLVEHVKDLEVIVTGSELEALILENNLVKKHRPRYNVVLRDDKNYPYLRLPLQDDYPRLEIVRRVRPDGAVYFGPYVPTHAMRETLRVLRTLFPLPNCNIVIDGTAERPCIEFEIKRCLAPCTGHQTKEEYREMVRQVRLFLEGKDRELIKILRGRMEVEAAGLRFEEAARLRDRIAKIERTLERQRITMTEPVDQDVIALSREGDATNVQILFIRGGLMIGRKDFFLERMAEIPDEEVYGSILQQFYHQEGLVPPELVLSARPSEAELLEQWLGQKRGGPVRLIVPSRGHDLQILRLAQENARVSLNEHLRGREQTEAVLSDLKARLGLKRLPHRIEGFDISNILGEQAVGSLVVFEGGRPKKSDYRHFRIRTIRGADDFGMIREVVQRHYAGRLSAAESLPDLILIDGGKGQLSVAIEALRAAGLTDRDVIGLAKAKGEKEERVFLPGQRDPLILDPVSPVTHLLQRVRDEAHRFAITHHRKRRGGDLMRSALDVIPGIGPARKRALLRRFGSLERLREAGLDELLTIPHMTREIAETVLRTLVPTVPSELSQVNRDQNDQQP